MKTIIRKAYWNYEKEEKWLNEMSAKGLALTDYSWCRYVFSDSQPGEYVYRIELLENIASHPVSQKYLRFMEESGVEYVASYMRWVYFRKKASDGVFDIYSDTDSKIKHYRRINRFWVIIAVSQMLIGSSNVFIWINSLSSGYPSYANLIAGCVCILLGLGFLVLGHPLRKKISELKKEKVVVE